jgi:hypothetical protein
MDTRSVYLPLQAIALSIIEIPNSGSYDSFSTMALAWGHAKVRCNSPSRYAGLRLLSSPRGAPVAELIISRDTG